MREALGQGHFSKHRLLLRGSQFTRESGGSSDTRLSSTSWSISSALRKQEKGRKRRAQRRASVQEDLTSEPLES